MGNFVRCFWLLQALYVSFALSAPAPRGTSGPPVTQGNNQGAPTTLSDLVVTIDLSGGTPHRHRLL